MQNIKYGLLRLKLLLYSLSSDILFTVCLDLFTFSEELIVVRVACVPSCIQVAMPDDSFERISDEEDCGPVELRDVVILLLLGS